MGTITRLKNINHSPVTMLMTIENGEVIHTRHLRNDEFAMTLAGFLEVAKQAGYKITAPEPLFENGNNEDS